MDHLFKHVRELNVSRVLEVVVGLQIDRIRGTGELHQVPQR